MEDDMLFLEDILDLPPAWEKMKQDKNNTTVNSTHKQYTFAHYMKLLKPWDLKLLYSVLEPDFTTFNYDPCEGF